MSFPVLCICFHNGQELEALHHVSGPRLPSQSSLAERHCRRMYGREPSGVIPGGRDATARTKDCRSKELNLKSESSKRGDGVTVSPPRSSERRPAAPPSSLDRLAHPKYPPKSNVTSDRLFGKNGILPLQSQKRAKARLEAATSTRSGVLNHHTTEKKHRRGQAIRSGDRPSKSCMTPYKGSFRRTAWEDERGTSVVAFARHAVDARSALCSRSKQHEKDVDVSLRNVYGNVCAASIAAQQGELHSVVHSTFAWSSFFQELSISDHPFPPRWVPQQSRRSVLPTLDFVYSSSLSRTFIPLSDTSLC